MINRSWLATAIACAGLASFTAGIVPGNASESSEFVGAFSSLTQLNSFTQEHPDEFAGVYVDPQTKIVHVDVSSSISGDALTQLRKSASEASSMTVVLENVSRNYTQLASIMSEVTKVQPWASETSNLLSSWSIDPATDKVRVGLTTVTPQLKQESSKMFGDAVTLYQQDRMRELDRYVPVTNPKIVQVDPKTLGRNTPASADTAGAPLLDSPPYIGGDRMIREIFNPDGSVQGLVECTAGLAWNNGGPTPFMATAGHCGPVNYSWQQGYYDPDSNTIYESGSMGTAFANSFGEHQVDGMLMDNGGDFASEVWENLSGSYQAPGVTSVINAAEGQNVCLSGSFTGTRCTGVVTVPDGCDAITYTDPDTGVTTTIDLCDLTTVNSPTSIVQSGDSGGPVFYGNPALGKGVAGAGVISAGSADGTEALYSNRTGLKSYFTGDFDTL